MISCSFCILATVCLFVFIKSADCSKGDKDNGFNTCMYKCTRSQCDKNVYKNQPEYLEYLGWDCKGECEYRCMWQTVDVYKKNNMKVPQFFGKWPFIRFFGLQEPAAVVASILNLFVHIWGIIALRRSVPSNTPLYWFWHVFALVCINGWIWSTIFHTRDTPFTEHMDYFSAFSLILFSLFSGLYRMQEGDFSSKKFKLVAVTIFSYYCAHVYYLAYVKFDYGYNMKANIFAGILNAFTWMTWCYLSIRDNNRQPQSHIFKCVLFVILAFASVLLEVMDFPPLYWILDAHALWHFSTALISPLWYSFLIDDCKHLRQKQLSSIKEKKEP